MPSKLSRKFISFNPHRFQKPLINFLLFPCTITFAVLFTYIGLLYYDLTSHMYALHLDNPLLIDQRIFSIIIVLWVLMFFVLYWAYRVSNHLVGAFDRIIRELDEYLDGGKKKHIHSRKNDQLADELLKRINAMIDRIPDKPGK